MEGAFAIVLFVVVGVAVVAAVWALATSSGSYQQIGRGGMSIGDDGPRRPAAGPGDTAIREAEIRQMLEARNARRIARGEAPVDVDAELRALTAPAADPALREEVRTLVEARNARRVARGEEPLDVEAETDRQLRELGT
jgi:Spy/CpxP family protein refolding chaperone